MKNLLALLAILLCSLGVRAQSVPATQPFKGANTIVIQTQDSARVALKKFAQCLIQSGNLPESAQSNMGFITSRPTPVGNSVNTTTLTINGAVSEAYPATLTLTGPITYGFMDSKPLSGKATFDGAENAPRKKAFREMERVARLYPAGALHYSQR
ncbi:hypothetical protein [Hymenobacter sp. BT491]|uniref:hypothetical protein n=1 Tax=Hymenobacter sp. BT491 TaxID=2766779 RepID=UPI001653BCF7|nr:hypothetical protein [Hymenobacter sp. BT491]MBC6988930.1 hypothetical protein [Hymenobacter sp. BT491]